MIRPVAGRPLIIQWNRPAIGPKLSRPDNIHRKDIDGATTRTQHGREDGQELTSVIWRIAVVGDVDTIVLRIKRLHQSRVDAIGVLFNVVDVDGLPITASSVAGATAGRQQRGGCTAAQAGGNGTLKECPASHATSTDFGDDFVDDFTLFRVHVGPPSDYTLTDRAV